MSCPHRQRRCKHALSRYEAAMHIYSAVQQSVANGEDSEWDDEFDGDDPDDACHVEGSVDDEHDALEELALKRFTDGSD